MRLKLFGFEVEIRRETTAERLERVIRARSDRGKLKADREELVAPPQS